ESVMANTRPPLELAQRVRGEEQSALAEAKRHGWEGLLAKLRGSPYVGTRSADWLKLKVLGTDELVIAGWTPISNGAAEIGALLVAARRDGRFVYAGKVGTGFDRAMRRRLLTLLKKDEVPRPAVEDAPRMRDARWVTPRHVAQLQFTEWTRDGKLRHPSFQGLREDKGAQEIGQDEAPVPASSRRTASSSRAASSGQRAAGRAVSAARARTTTARASGRGGKTRAGKTAGRKATSSKSRRSTEPGDGDPQAATGFFGSAPSQGFGTWHSNRGEEDERPAAPAPAPEIVAAEPPPAEVPITHPEKVLFSGSKITKRDVREYMDAVAPALIAALRGRPLSMQQWPQGIGKPGIFRQGATSAPPWISRVTVQHADHPLEHIVVERPQTVSWLANQSALTLHMTSSRAATVENPDWVAFDFDPATGWEQIVPVALALKGLLDELKLVSIPKTSGKRGLHVFVPLGPGHSHDQALGFAQAVAAALAARFPDQATTERSLNRRRGRLYLDAFQNGRLKTMVAPYSIRAVEAAPVSTPLEWDEVDARLDPGTFNIRSMPARLRERGDLFAAALEGKQRLPEFRA
ncbi:MAG TPA: non-homologous end-joining DNA ligase, partial [Myxococcaceae bacterium]